MDMVKYYIKSIVSAVWVWLWLGLAIAIFIDPISYLTLLLGIAGLGAGIVRLILGKDA